MNNNGVEVVSLRLIVLPEFVNIDLNIYHLAEKSCFGVRFA